jgi:hypothetical protein
LDHARSILGFIAIGKMVILVGLSIRFQEKKKMAEMEAKKKMISY